MARLLMTGVFLTVLVMTIALSQADDGDDSSGGRRRRRNRGKGDDEDEENEYTWQQNVAANRAVTKTAEAPMNRGVIIIESEDDDLNDLGFVESTTVYDYTTGSSLVAIQPKGRGPCFLTDESLSYQELLNGVKKLNGTTVAERSPEIILDGTGEPLRKEDEHVIFTSNPDIKEVCGRASVVLLVEPGDLPPSAGDTKEIKVLTYDAELIIIAPAGRRG